MWNFDYFKFLSYNKTGPGGLALTQDKRIGVHFPRPFMLISLRLAAPRRVDFQFPNFMNILKELPGIKKNVLLAPYTTFRIGGPAKYFFLAKNKEDIIKAVKSAKKNNLPFFILGSGSNLLVSDKGFKGLVIKLQVASYKLQKNRIITEAGVLLAKIVNLSIKNNLTGLEWTIGIPGTIAGAVRGNAGAYGHSISESVNGVQVLTCKGEILNYTNQDCQFGYRDSIFKRNKEIILEVVLQLTKGNKEKTQKQIKEYLTIRKNKIPPYPSAGSIFKNLPSQVFLRKNLRGQEKIKNGMVPTGYLIEQCGLKGKQIGQAKISDQHANFIVNLNGAKAKDVIALIKICKKEVKKKFGVDLEEEIKII